VAQPWTSWRLQNRGPVMYRMAALHTRLVGPQIACCEGVPHCESMSQSFLGWERPAALWGNRIATNAREGCPVGCPDWIPWFCGFCGGMRWVLACDSALVIVSRAGLKLRIRHRTECANTARGQGTHDANAEHAKLGSTVFRMPNFQMVGTWQPPMRPLGEANRTRAGGQTDASDQGRMRSSLDCRSP